MCSAFKAAPGGPLQPDVISYGAVALGFCRLGSVARGLGVLTAYTHTGQRLSPAVFEPCMAAAAVADDDAAIISIWRHMASLGIASSSACSTMFIGAASRSRSAGADLSPLLPHACGGTRVPACAWLIVRAAVLSPGCTRRDTLSVHVAQPAALALPG